MNNMSDNHAGCEIIIVPVDIQLTKETKTSAKSENVFTRAVLTKKAEFKKNNTAKTTRKDDAPSTSTKIKVR